MVLMAKEVTTVILQVNEVDEIIQEVALEVTEEVGEVQEVALEVTEEAIAMVEEM